MGQEVGLALFLKAYQWCHSPGGGGSCLGNCSQEQKEPPSVLNCRARGSWHGKPREGFYRRQREGSFCGPRGDFRGILAPTDPSLCS